jgi:hypothetical protein
MCIHWLGLTSSEDFVSYEEAGGVIILLEFIHDLLKGRQLSFVPVGSFLSTPIASVCFTDLRFRWIVHTCSICVVKVSRSTNKYIPASANVDIQSVWF